VPLHVLENPKVVPGERDCRGHRSHCCRTHSRAGEQRGAGAFAVGRRRLPSFASAAASRHRGRRVDDHGGRPDCRRIGLSPCRWLGRGRDAAQDWCFVAKGETARETLGTRAGPDGTRAAGPRRSSRCRTRRASRPSAEPALSQPRRRSCTARCR
jgi:hypothetical protein